MRSLFALSALVALGGCRLWYQPVPITNAIGKERTVVAADSFNVHRDPRFEVYGPGTQSVFDAYEQLNRAYRAFDRYFGAPTPRLAVVLTEASARSDSTVDRALRARGLTILRYARPRRARMQERLGEAGYGGSFWPVGPVAARMLLASLVATVSAPETPLDTNTLTRFPAWYRSAVMGIVGDATSLPFAIAYAKENRGSRLSLDRLLAVERSPSADSTLDPTRRADADEHDRRLSAQASAFAQFLLDREGPDVLRQLGRGFAAGRTFEQVAADFKALPRNVPDIDERWLAWLAAQRIAY